MLPKISPYHAPIFETLSEFKEYFECHFDCEETHLYVTSGGMDPLHPGHISVLDGMWYLNNDAFNLVIVNGDEFLRRKKGASFMPQLVRCQIIASLISIDGILAFNPSDPADMTVCEALRELKPVAFCKGGDRTGIENIPEWDVCQEYGIEIVTGLGDDKLWSSSHFLADWDNRCRS